MEFLLLTRRDRNAFSDAEAKALFPAEAIVVQRLKADGFIKAIWSRNDLAGACLLLEAEDEAAAREGLKPLPLFEAGMLQIEALVPLRPY
jgi:muconolactone delta-isomerase